MPKKQNLVPHIETEKVRHGSPFLFPSSNPSAQNQGSHHRQTQTEAFMVGMQIQGERLIIKRSFGFAPFSFTWLLPLGSLSGGIQGPAFLQNCPNFSQFLLRSDHEH